MIKRQTLQTVFEQTRRHFKPDYNSNRHPSPLTLNHQGSIPASNLLLNATKYLMFSLITLPLSLYRQTQTSTFQLELLQFRQHRILIYELLSYQCLSILVATLMNSQVPEELDEVPCQLCVREIRTVKCAYTYCTGP